MWSSPPATVPNSRPVTLVITVAVVPNTGALLGTGGRVRLTLAVPLRLPSLVLTLIATAPPPLLAV
jgi:hypothetical protein